MSTYYTTLTEAGVDALANAALTGRPVGFSWMGVGDGSGVRVKLAKEQDGLRNERYRAPLNRLVIADQGANVIRAEMVMPPEVGGFWMREAALYDDDGVCLALANVPDSYKPLLEEGSGRLQAVNLWVAVTSTADVVLKADPSVILASQAEVARAKNEAKDYSDKLVGEMNTDFQLAINVAVKQALADAWEADNPIGTVRFFNCNLNPNEHWPHSQWVYTGENRSIRVGAADGSNVGNTEGSDSVRIEQRNLPAVQLDVSGETSEKAAQIIETTPDGLHRHGTFGEAPGVGIWPFGFYDETPQYLGSNDSDGDNGLLNSTEDGEHKHQATVPAHTHTVSGKTASLGQGQELNIVESHILLMCWARIA